MAEAARGLLVGLIAGSAGKAALDLATYADMLLRARPASDVPARVAERLAGEVADRSDEVDGFGEAAASDADEGGPGPRASAAGALGGYTIGLGLGAGYALLRSQAGALPPAATILGGATLSALAMAGSDLPAVATGATSDPRRWPWSSWLADLVPHLAYGLVTAVSVELLLAPRASSPAERLIEAVTS